MPARLLPDRPNLTQYKKRAKELVKASYEDVERGNIGSTSF
jgi:hypothetical protein